MGLDQGLFIQRRNRGKLSSKLGDNARELVYWRKANQIHKWFVDNIQEGTDDCKSYIVPKEKLVELLELCKKVVLEARVKNGRVETGYGFKKNIFGKEVRKYQYREGVEITNKRHIKKLLPTCSGFFFGLTGYDENYLDQIFYTIYALTKILEEEDFDKQVLLYTSSW